jgi:hypothetical protein
MATSFWRPAAYRFGVLVATTLALCATATAQSVTSTAYSRGHLDPIPEPQATTHVPGEAVTDASSSSFVASGTSGSVSGSALAETDYGLNRVAVSGGIVGISSFPDFGFAFVDGLGYSIWNDSLLVSGGAVGDLVNLSLSGRTTYLLDLTGGASVSSGSPALQLEQQFVADSSIGSGRVTLDTDDFAAAAPQGFLDWTVSFAAHSGDTVTLTMVMQASLSSSFLGLDLGITDKHVIFDSSNTALLKTLDVTDGYSLSAASGELVADNGAFAYRAVLAATPVTPVPEPETYALMLAGLAAVGVAARRRKNRER